MSIPQINEKYGLVAFHSRFDKVKIVHTEWLYYDKFAYRLAYIYNRTVRNRLTGGIEKRKTDRNVHFRTLDEMNERILVLNSDKEVTKLIKVSVPINEKHLELLKSKSPNVLCFREDYYYNNFKYQFEARSEITEDQRVTIARNYPELTIGCTNTLFSETDMDDDLRVFLRLNDVNIKKTREVILLEEVE